MSTSKKHILVLPKWYPNPKDIQLGTFIKQQALLLKNKFEISVIYVQSDDSIENKFEVRTNAKNGIFEQIVLFKKSNGLLGKLINLKRYRDAQKLAYSNLLSSVDLVHVHVPIRPLFLALWLKQKKNIPFVVTEHWSGHLTGAYAKKNSLYKYLYSNLLKQAQNISCVSEYLKAEFIKNTKLGTQVIPNLIEQKHSSNPTVKSNLEQISILSVNDLIDSIKNVTGLLSAFKEALNTHPNLHLTLIGGGPDQLLIQNTIEQLNLSQSNLTFLGRQSHDVVLDHMECCDFYISNSNFETFGMTIAEALLNGKPVISKLCGGPNEFLNKRNSLIVKTDEKADLVHSIIEMATIYFNFDPKLISQEIVEKYGHKVVLEKLEDFYTKL